MCGGYDLYGGRCMVWMVGLRIEQHGNARIDNLLARQCSAAHRQPPSTAAQHSAEPSAHRFCRPRKELATRCPQLSVNAFHRFLHRRCVAQVGLRSRKRSMGLSVSIPPNLRQDLGRFVSIYCAVAAAKAQAQPKRKPTATQS